MLVLVKSGLTLDEALKELRENPTYCLSRPVHGWKDQLYKYFVGFCVYKKGVKPEKPKNLDMLNILIVKSNRYIEGFSTYSGFISWAYEDITINDLEVWKWEDK